MIKTFNWLVLEINVKSICLQENWTHKENMTVMTLGNLSYHRMFSNRKKGNTAWYLKSICFSFLTLFLGKLS